MTTDHDTATAVSPDDDLPGTPSRVEEGEPVLARQAGTIGACFLLFGLLMWVWNLYEKQHDATPRFAAGVIRLWWLLGLSGLLTHVTRERAAPANRIYAGLILVLCQLGVQLAGFAAAVEWSAGNTAAGLISAGVLGLLLIVPATLGFALDEPATAGKGLGQRWVGGLTGSNRVQQVLIAGLAAGLAAFGLVYYVRQVEAWQLFYTGLGCLLLGLLFGVPYLTNEGQAGWRGGVALLLFGVGGLAALTSLAGTVTDWVGLPDVVLPHGLLFGVLGLIFLATFATKAGAEAEVGYRTALGLGVVGLLMIVLALARSVFQEHYLVPTGFIMLVLGSAYFFFGWGFLSDNRLMVLTRRELASLFFSPVAYIVVAGLVIVAWAQFAFFIDLLVPTAAGARPEPEPIVAYYFLSLLPVFALMAAVPALAMRALSEEQRSGTLEVLLTAPVNEWMVVLSKFLGTWVFFILAWGVWNVFPLALRVYGKESFDYRPLLSMNLGTAVMATNFVAMTLFCSSLTRNQIVAYLLGLAGMVVQFLPFQLTSGASETARNVYQHVGYVHHLFQFALGKVQLTTIVFHLSLTLFWLFLTVKVLESRRWK